MAHRIDEYLQATVVSLSPGQLQASIRLIPGVLLAPSVIATIDGDADGILSDTERAAYATRVLADLSVTLDGVVVRPTLTSWRFPETAALREGLDEIRIEFRAALPDAPGDHALTLANRHHLGRDSVYLVNAAVPDSDALHVLSQRRNETQSDYVLTYRQDGAAPVPSQAREQGRTELDDVASASLFSLGMRHIAEGTDHLLFLLTLLLSAPVVAVQGRWGRPAGVGDSVRRIAGVVTAFTLGHSLTLATVVLGLAPVPEQPVEVLVALSILVSAAHAVRPLFPRREAWVAGAFGLVHGLAFAATLGRLGLGLWDRAIGVLTFNLGIEAMQLLVVGCTLPGLLLLSRTPAYAPVRLAGGVLAGTAALAWTTGRLLDTKTPFDPLIDGLAAQAPWFAAGSFLLGMICYTARRGGGIGRKLPVRFGAANLRKQTSGCRQPD